MLCRVCPCLSGRSEQSHRVAAHRVVGRHARAAEADEASKHPTAAAHPAEALSDIRGAVRQPREVGRQCVPEVAERHQGPMVWVVAAAHFQHVVEALSSHPEGQHLDVQGLEVGRVPPKLMEAQLGAPPGHWRRGGDACSLCHHVCDASWSGCGVSQLAAQLLQGRQLAIFRQLLQEVVPHPHLAAQCRYHHLPALPPDL